MGIIKKIIDRELVGGTTNEEVYPISSTKAIYDPNNNTLDYILNKLLSKIGEVSARHGYYICSTISSEPDKEIEVPNFELSTNIRLLVKMGYSNTVDNVSFEINDTGAYPLYYNNSPASNFNSWVEGEVLDIYFDGSSFRAFSSKGEDSNSPWVLKVDSNGKQYVYTSLPIVGSKGLTTYATDDVVVPSLFDGLPIDNVTIYWEENEEGKRVLKSKGGTGGASNWDELQGKPSWIGSEKPSYTWDEIKGDKPFYTKDELNSKYVTTDETEQDVSGLKNFLSGISIGSSKKKIYEKDGVLYIDSDVAITGSLTTFALGTTAVSTIMDGVVVDGTTITKENGMLKVIGGGGGASSWDELDGKPTTIAGFGITDAYTKTEAGNKFVDVSGDTMTGVLKLNEGLFLPYGKQIDSTWSYLLKTSWAQNYGDYFELRITGQNGVYSSLIGTTHSSKELYWNENKVWHAGNDGDGSGLDADSVDGYGSSKLAREVYAAARDSNLSTQWLKITPTNEYTRNIFLISRYWNGLVASYMFNYDLYRPSYQGLIQINGGGTMAFEWYFDSSLKCYYLAIPPNSNFTITSFNNRDQEKYEIVDSPTGTQYQSRAIAGLDSNVASATKLQTPRTIWGQSFDGTSNITGIMSGMTGFASGGWNDSWSDGTNSHPWYGYDHRYANTGVFSTTFSDHFGLCFKTKLGYLVMDINGSVGIGTVSPSYKLHVAGTTYSNRFISGFDSGQDNSFSCSNWFRSSGETGWYNQTHGGGIRMANDTYVEVYNSKAFKVNNQTNYAFNSAGGYYSNWNNSYEINAANLLNTSLATFNKPNLYVNQNTLQPILSWANTVNGYGYITRYSISSLRNINDRWGRMRLAVGANDAGTVVGCFMDIDGDGIVTVGGNLLVSGGITCYTSDERAKTVIEELNLSLKQISESPTIRFKWNGWNIEDDGKTHIGGIAQYVQKLLPECILDADGVLNMDYSTTAYIYSVQTARHLRKYETKTDKEIRNLKKRVLYLERKLKSLGYEESDTLVN